MPVVGAALLVIGVVHVVLTPVVYPDAWDSVLEAGVIASVEADEAVKELRSAGFWYATAGLGQLMVAALVWSIERRLGVAPRVVGWMLLGLAVWGVALVPNSGFWAFFITAGLVFGANRRAAGRRRESAVTPATTQPTHDRTRP